MKISFRQAQDGPMLSDDVILETVDGADDYEQTVIAKCVTNYLFTHNDGEAVTDLMVRKAYALAFALSGVDVKDEA